VVQRKDRQVLGGEAAKEEDIGHLRGEPEWFTVSEAAERLQVPVSQIYDGIRDGRLRVRFRPGEKGESERPMVSSPELHRVPDAVPVQSEGMGPETPGPQDRPKEVEDAWRKEISARQKLEAEAAARAQEIEQLRVSEQEACAELEALETRFDESLKGLYDRDVKIARLEAQVEASHAVRDVGKTFVDQLQHRVVRLEEGADEKEKEIRRLALALGEARGEIRLLRAPEDAVIRRPPWYLRLFPYALAAAAAGLVFTMAYLLSRATEHVAAGVVAVSAFALTLVALRFRGGAGPKR